MSNDSVFSNVSKNIRAILEGDSALLSFYSESQHDGGGKRLYWTDENVVMPAGERPARSQTPILAVYMAPTFQLAEGAQRIWNRDFTLTFEGGVYDNTSNSQKLARFFDIVSTTLLTAATRCFRVDGDPFGANGKVVAFDLSDVLTTLGPPGDERGRAGFHAFIFDITFQTALTT